MIQTKPGTIDSYIAGCPGPVQDILRQIRNTIRKAVPGAEEKISYGIPAFALGGHDLVYFAAYKKHIGLYPVPGGNKEFEKDFASYETSGRGTIRFPLDRPLPHDLITRIVKFRIKEAGETEKKKVLAKKKK